MFCRSAGNTVAWHGFYLTLKPVFTNLSNRETLLELLFIIKLIYEDHGLCITRLAAKCQSMNNNAAGRHDADEDQLFHGNGCGELK